MNRICLCPPLPTASATGPEPLSAIVQRHFGTGPRPTAGSANGRRTARCRLAEGLKKRNAFELLEQEVTINLVRTADRLIQKVMPDARTPLIGAEYNILRILRGNDETLSAEEIASR